MKDAFQIIKPNSQKCALCLSGKNDVLHLGEKYKLRGLVVHAHCVIFSKSAFLKGKKADGAKSFVYADIKHCQTRAKTVLCEYCEKPGAATRCQICRIDFHLPCGINKGAVNIFKGRYPTLCGTHRPRQVVPVNLLSEAQLNPPTCNACLDTVAVEDEFNSLWASCCKKTWYHRDCVQKIAIHSGALFKCSVCSDTKTFLRRMTKNGIYVPKRDASWESDESAFDILNERYSHCDAVVCRAPLGRTHDQEGTRWEIVLCQACGAQGTHVVCSNLRFLASAWECPDCRRTGRPLPLREWVLERSCVIAENENSDGEVEVVSLDRIPVSDSEDEIEII